MKPFIARLFFLGLSSLLLSIPAYAVSGYQNNNGTCMNNGRPLCYEPESGSPNPHCDSWIDGGSHCSYGKVVGTQEKLESISKVTLREKETLNDASKIKDFKEYEPRKKWLRKGD